MIVLAVINLAASKKPSLIEAVSSGNSSKTNVLM